MTLEIRDSAFGGSALTHAFSDRRSPAHWYPLRLPPREDGAEFWKKRVDSVRPQSSDWIDALAEAILVTPGTAAGRRLDAARETRGVAVTTGQQPGLFGGPLYTLSKALSARALADEISRLTGVPTIPVFWAATDDADALEAGRTVVPGETEACVLEMPHAKGDSVPLAALPLPDLSHELDTLRRTTGSGVHSALIERVADAYSAGHTVGSAYVALLRAVLEPLGICVLDAAHAAVRRAAGPLLLSAAQRAEDLERALSARNAELITAGFKPQVKEVRGRALVFAYSDREKHRIRIGDDLSHSAGDSLSPTVLLRPIVERAIIPTVAYVAGPAEVAYFAQVSAVAEALGADQPCVVPRWSGFVVEPRVRRVLDRHDLRIDDFADPHRLDTLTARAAIPETVRKAMEELKGAITRGVTTLSEAPDNPLPPRVIPGLERNILHRIERLERRAAAAIKRSGTEKLREIAIARASLFPGGSPQERTMSWAAMLGRYGPELIDAMSERATAHMKTLA